jgi:hypothetical protein
MGIFSGDFTFGAADCPIVDSPYSQQFDVGVATPPPPSGDNFLLLDGTDLLLLSGGNFELL